ncbi:MAG TPA: thiamine pyrophosphate-dependent enzyme [Hyphomicrobiaceae bacterium]|nr:thiamine pyrophosphate-dependent enzyme [Hyphomicrobiaceae bacterium]
MTRMTTAEATVECLIGNGIDTIYGLPGLHNDALFDAFHRAKDRLRVLHTRHEQTAGYMALGAALATGKPQAFAVVPGPGVLNASAALLTAYGMNAPVVALVGQIPHKDIDRAYGHLHELPDQLGLLRHITKAAARVRAAHDAPAIVCDLIRQSISGRQRPVAVECAIDIWGRAGSVELPSEPVAPVRTPVDEDAVEAAAKILGKAKRVLIVVGGGAQDASAEVRHVAEMLEAPVVGYRRGRGVLASSHRLSVPLPIAHRLWKEADAVLAIGTRLFQQQSQWGVDADLNIVRIEIDPEEPDRFSKTAAAVIGDAASVLRTLLIRLAKHNVKRGSRQEELAQHRVWFAERLKRLEPQVSYLKAMRAALPEDGIFIDEVTQVGFASRIAFPVEQPRTFLSPGYQDNLGWGYGAALGVKSALPDRAVLAIAGDGGFLYQIGELATAAQHRLAVVVVVFDDGAYGNVKRIQQERFGNRLIACELQNPDFTKLAESFGVAAFRAKTAADLERVLKKAFALDAPALVHVPCGEMPSPWDMILMPRVRG